MYTPPPIPNPLSMSEMEDKDRLHVVGQPLSHQEIQDQVNKLLRSSEPPEFLSKKIFELIANSGLSLEELKEMITNEEYLKD